MSIFVHHGAPGSYKTSGALWLRLLPAIKSGRPIVTNIRGLKLGVIAKHLGINESDIVFIFVDTDHPNGRIHLAKFWHWAPKDAFIFIDECGRIWSPKLTMANLKALDTPSDLVEEGRPETFEVAFDMHRHHGWDICLTTPNISKVHGMIRDAAEIGYRHFNRATMGLGAKFTLTTHDATNSGLQDSHATTREIKKVPKYVFKMYQSTTTGKARDTLAGTPFWKDRKIVILSLFIISLFSYSFYGLYDNELITGGNYEKQVSTNEQSTITSTQVPSHSLPSFCVRGICFQDNSVTYDEGNYQIVNQFPDLEYKGIFATGFDKFKGLTVYFESQQGSVPTELFNYSYRYSVLSMPDYNEFLVFDKIRQLALIAPVRRGAPIKSEKDDSLINVSSVF